jgi:methyltransferase
VRVLVLPGDPAVVAGPYRYLRHPNYLAVVIEGFAVPLVHTAWLTALAFTLANAALLRVRIRCEEQALAAHCDYARRLGDRPRLIPARRATA